MLYHIFCKETHKYLCTYTNAESLNTLDTTRCYYKEETVLIAYANDSNPLANKYRTTDNNDVSRSSRNKSNSSSQSSNSSNSGYSSFLAEVNDYKENIFLYKDKLYSVLVNIGNMEERFIVLEDGTKVNVP